MTTPVFDPSNINVQLVTDTSLAFEFLRWISDDRSPIMGVDTETDGLDWFDGKLRLVQFGNLTEGWAIPFERFSNLVLEALEILSKRRTHIVMHNHRFDLHWLDRHAGWQVKDWSLVHDTMLLAGVIDSSGTKALKDLAEFYVHPLAKVGQSALKADMKKGNWEWGTVPIELPSFWLYACLDTILTVHLFYVLLDKAQQSGCMEAYATERGAMPTLYSIERKGMLVDSEYCSTHQESLLRRCEEIETEVSGWGIDNVGSLPQLAVAFERAGVELVDKTGSGKWAMNKDAFEGIVARNGEHPLVTLIDNYRGNMKMANSYYANFLKYQKSDGRVHPSYRQMQAKTGRMSCADPAMQTIPRPDDNAPEAARLVRNAFVAESGHVLISTDFSNVEARIFAHFAQEEGMLKAIRDGINLHQYTAQRIFNLDTLVDKSDKRYTTAKNTLFCVPTTTKALTVDGPKSVDELRVGDMVAGYSGGAIYWTPVRQIHNLGLMETIRFGNNHRSFTATANHRWVGEKRWLRDGIPVWEPCTMTTEDFLSVKGNRRIVLSAPFDVVDQSGLSVLQASLLGWLITDGHIHWNKSKNPPETIGLSATITQIKKVGREAIERDLHTVIRSKTDVNFVIYPQAVRDLFTSSGLNRDYSNLYHIVLKMGTEQVTAFMDAAWLAEGCLSRNTISQNEGFKYDAIRLATFMTGKVPGKSRLAIGGIPTNKVCRQFTLSQPLLSSDNSQIFGVQTEPVWCVTTDLDSWVALDDDGMYFLTGNCTIFGGGPSKISATAGISIEEGQAAYKGLHTAFPGIKKFQKVCEQNGIDNLNQYGKAFVRGVDGRILSMIESDTRWYAFTNWIIQSTAAIVLKQRLSVIDNMGLTSFCVAAIHDEVLAEVPDEDAEDFKVAIQEAMNDSTSYTIPIVATSGNGAVRWGDTDH